MTLEIVSDEGTYYVLSDESGDEIYVRHGDFARLVPFHDLDLADEWRNFPGNDVDKFRDFLAAKVIDPEYTEEVTLCEDCGDVEETPYGMSSVDHGYVCEACIYDYAYCEYCSEYVHGDSSVWIEGSDERVCEPCCDRYFTYCEHCDSYNSNDYPCDCSEDCDCESPVQSFTIPNDGHDPLKNDTPLATSLPAGTVSEEGMHAIMRLIQAHASEMRPYGYVGGRYVDFDHHNPEHVAANEEYQKWWSLSQDVLTMDAKWQTKDGNFTKRLSRMAYKSHGLKVPPAMLSEVGNLGNQHSQGVDFEIEVTRDLNQSAEAFGHSDSCYWQSYYSSRCTLKSNGAFGLRSFGANRNDWQGGVTGRAWVLPLKSENGNLTPTFDAQGADAYVVFNGYGDLSGYAPARIMAHMAGMTYRKIEFTLGEAYINAGGYLIAPEEIAQSYTDGALNLYVDPHENVYGREVAAAA